MKFGCLVMTLLLPVTAMPASARSWLPQKNVEIVVGSAPGGSNDKTARTVERVFAVNVNSPIKSGKDLVERLKKDLDGDYAAMKSVLVEIGLAKQ